MIDDEGDTSGSSRRWSSGRWTKPRGGSRRPTGAALESAPERAVAARRFRFRVAARPAAVARRPMGAAPSAPSRCGKRGQEVRRWLERRGRRAVRPSEGRRHGSASSYARRRHGVVVARRARRAARPLGTARRACRQASRSWPPPASSPPPPPPVRLPAALRPTPNRSTMWAEQASEPC